MGKRSILFGVLGLGAAWLVFYLIWGVLFGLSALWPEHLVDWAMFLPALLIPAAYAAIHEYEFGDYFVDSLKFVGLFLLACIGANMIGFSLGAVVAFIEALIYKDYETIGMFLGLAATLVFIGGPGGGVTVWVFEFD